MWVLTAFFLQRVFGPELSPVAERSPPDQLKVLYFSLLVTGKCPAQENYKIYSNTLEPGFLLSQKTTRALKTGDAPVLGKELLTKAIRWVKDMNPTWAISVFVTLGNQSIQLESSCFRQKANESHRDMLSGGIFLHLRSG